MNTHTNNHHFTIVNVYYQSNPCNEDLIFLLKVIILQTLNLCNRLVSFAIHNVPYDKWMMKIWAQSPVMVSRKLSCTKWDISSFHPTALRIRLLILIRRMKYNCKNFIALTCENSKHFQDIFLDIVTFILLVLREMKKLSKYKEKNWFKTNIMINRFIK